MPVCPAPFDSRGVDRGKEDGREGPDAAVDGQGQGVDGPEDG